MKIPNIHACTRGEVAAVVGVSDRQITRWKADGCPVNPDDTLDLPKIVRWLIEREAQAASGKAGKGADSPWLEEYRKQKALMCRDERKRRRGLLIEKDVVSQDVADRVCMFRNTVRSWRCRLPPLIVGKSEADMLPIIEKEMDDALQALSDEFGRIIVQAAARPKGNRHGKTSSPSGKAGKQSKKNVGSARSKQGDKGRRHASAGRDGGKAAVRGGKADAKGKPR